MTIVLLLIFTPPPLTKEQTFSSLILISEQQHQAQTCLVIVWLCWCSSLSYCLMVSLHIASLHVFAHYIAHCYFSRFPQYVFVLHQKDLTF